LHYPVLRQNTLQSQNVAKSSCILNHLEEITNRTPTVILEIDNQSTSSLIKNGIVNKHSKHIDVHYRFVHDLIKNKSVNIKYCPSEKQVADLLTKALTNVKFKQLPDNIVG